MTHILFSPLPLPLLKRGHHKLGCQSVFGQEVLSFQNRRTHALIPVIRGHFSRRINPFLLPTLVLLQSNAPRVASKQFYVYACCSNCHRWNLMGIFSSNKVEVSTYWFESWASVKGGQEGRPPPPHFHDAGAGAPSHFDKGAPKYLQEKGYIVGYAKQMVLKEQWNGPFRPPKVSVESIWSH